MQEALAMCNRPGLLSFGLGLPATEHFPADEFARACAETLRVNARALQYQKPLEELKSQIVSIMALRGVACGARNVFITSGAQQALHLLVALLCDHRRQIITEDLSYPGFHQIVGFYQPEVLTVSSDLKTGMNVDEVERHLNRGIRPAFIYTVPDGHNPLGASLSEEKRERLFQLTQQYGVPLIEEDPYGLLYYSEYPSRPIRSYTDEYVFYVGSFSKILAPSIRVGWIIAPEPAMPLLSILKESYDIDTATYSQHVVSCMLGSGFLTEHLRRLRSEYSRRREAMLSSLSDYFPADTEWYRPQCGVYVWARLRHGLDTSSLLKTAISEHNVAFIPGAVFSISRTSAEKGSMRLNFSYPSVANIKEGMQRLGACVSSAST